MISFILKNFKYITNMDHTKETTETPSKSETPTKIKSKVEKIDFFSQFEEYVKTIGDLDITKFLKEYMFEIFLGLIVLGVIVFKLTNEFDFRNPLEVIDLNKTYESIKVPKIIWLYWNDPIEKAPVIVQVCVNLIQKFNRDFKIYLLNENSYKEYVYDEEIIQIMNSKLNHNYKSDLLRLYLIYEYGGIYIDSSILPFQSFEWIIDLMNKSDKDIFMYQNTQHTTIKTKPVCENWMIVAKEKNEVIQLIMDNFKKSLKEGVLISYKNLLSDKTVDYQNFITHGTFHLAYFVIIHTLTKNNLHDKIEYGDCSYSSYPCKPMDDNYKINELFMKQFTQNEFLKFCHNNKFVKLTSYNRDYIHSLDIKPIENSVIQRLLKM